MLNNLGSAKLQQGKVKAAEASYHEALEIDDRNALAWFNLAVILVSATVVLSGLLLAAVAWRRRGVYFRSRFNRFAILR